MAKNMSHRKNKNKSKKSTIDQDEVKLTDSVIIGAYSTDPNGIFKNDLSALKYLKREFTETPQNVHFDLKEIFSKMEPINKRSFYYLERLNILTQFIQENPGKMIKDGKVDADFVCFRGVLIWLLKCPYNYSGFTLEAVKLKETIYLALKTDKQQPPDHLTIFETCLLTSNPKNESAATTKDEFNVVFSRNLDEIKILFAAECDAVISEDVIENLEDLELSKLIEIKSRIDKEIHDTKTYHDYLKLHYWCQSYIASIDTIYLGKRDDQAIVRKLETLNITSLEYPEYSCKFWDKNVCLTRLREFLQYIKADMEDVDDPHTVFRYEWKECEMTAIWKRKKDQFPVTPTKDYIEEFLPQNYISFINNLKN